MLPIALPLQNKLEYLKRYFNAHTMHPFNVVLIAVLHPFLWCTAKQITQIGHSLKECPYNAFRK